MHRAGRLDHDDDGGGTLPEQVVRKQTKADRLLGEGKDVADVCRDLGVSEQTYYRWRNQFGGLNANDAKRLKTWSGEDASEASARRRLLNEYRKVLTASPVLVAGRPG